MLLISFLKVQSIEALAKGLSKDHLWALKLRGYAYAWLPSSTEHYLPWRGIKFYYLLSSVFTAVPLRYQEEGIPGKVPSTHSGLFHS